MSSRTVRDGVLEATMDNGVRYVMPAEDANGMIQVGACKHGRAIHYAYPCKLCFFEKGLTEADYYARLEELRGYHLGKAVEEVAKLLDEGY